MMYSISVLHCKIDPDTIDVSIPHIIRSYCSWFVKFVERIGGGGRKRINGDQRIVMKLTHTGKSVVE